MAKTTIGPTEEQEIEVEFTPGTLGKQRKSVTLSFDDKTFKMEFIADVEN